ncbi:hypothetical protein [Streptomyces sp. SolWspMP-sol7th]
MRAVIGLQPMTAGSVTLDTPPLAAPSTSP